MGLASSPSHMLNLPPAIINNNQSKFSLLRSLYPSLRSPSSLSSSFSLLPTSFAYRKEAVLGTQEQRRVQVFCSQLTVEEVSDEDACELVNGSEIKVGEDSDEIRAYLFKAIKNNNGVGILLLSDVFGFEDSFTRDFAYRVACNGFNVLVPDLFRGDPWSRDRPNAIFEQWLAKQDPDRVAKDIGTSTKWMEDEFTAAQIPRKLGIIGFCYGGGPVVEVLARDQNSTFGTGVSFNGTRMSLNAMQNVKVPVLFITGDNDPLCPVGTLAELEKAIGKGSRVVVFKGRGHGFVHRPESPEEDADADEAFMIMRTWLCDHLLAS
ncbi:hypothetical protein Cgig2_017366 [Carnegiea gigantea]|uniref:Carboxymethylenebutenolidase homolog n=1 Tax=Carnegiea gigantea TaxID=171969 RepID=A0A9Q1K5T7_9CARY|nr:hypothetical protein Cgig2_017366 [Carnegiea gigantea]